MGKRDENGARYSRISQLPKVPFNDDYLEKTKTIFTAQQILYGPLHKYYMGKKKNVKENVDLSAILYYLKENFPHTNNEKKRLIDTNSIFQIIHMRNELSHQSYSVGCYDSDIEILTNLAMYLSTQLKVADDTLIQTITTLLGTAKLTNGLKAPQLGFSERSSPIRSRVSIFSPLTVPRTTPTPPSSRSFGAGITSSTKPAIPQPLESALFWKNRRNNGEFAVGGFKKKEKEK